MPDYHSKKLLDSVLTSVDQDALKQFIRRECTRNKYLEIKLLAYFIESIELDDEANKYALILNDVVKESADGKPKMSKRRISLLRDIVRHWLRISNKSIVQGHLRDAVDCITACLRSLHKYADKADQDDETTAALIVQLYEKLMYITHRTLAPELRYDIEDSGLELVQRSYYKMYDPQFNMVAVLAGSDSAGRHGATLIDIVRNKCQALADNTMWLAWYAILSQRVKNGHGRQLGNINVSVERTEQVLEILDSMHQEAAISWWIQNFSGKKAGKSQDSELWKRWQFKTARKQNDKEGTLEYGMNLLLEKPSVDLYMVLTDGLIAPEQVNDFLLQHDRKDVLAEIFGQLGRSDELWQLLRSANSLPLLNRFYPGQAVLEREDRLDDIWPIVRHFISHHAGTQCTDTVQAFFETLQRAGDEEIIEELSDRILREFPGRFKIDPVRLQIS